MELKFLKSQSNPGFLSLIRCTLVQPYSYLPHECRFLQKDSDGGDFKIELRVIANGNANDGLCTSVLSFGCEVPMSTFAGPAEYFLVSVFDDDDNCIDSLRIGGGSILAQAEPDETDKPHLVDPSSPFAVR